MIAKMGWRIHVEKNEICTTLWSDQGGDICTVNGFVSRMEAWMFIACYWVFLVLSKEDKATELLREFSTRTKAH